MELVLGKPPQRSVICRCEVVGRAKVNPMLLDIMEGTGIALAQP